MLDDLSYLSANFLGALWCHLNEPLMQENDVCLTLDFSAPLSPLSLPGLLAPTHQPPPQPIDPAQQCPMGSPVSLWDRSGGNGGCLSPEGVINATVFFLTASLFFLARALRAECFVAVSAPIINVNIIIGGCSCAWWCKRSSGRLCAAPQWSL